jgi:hypothetical protein
MFFLALLNLDKEKRSFKVRLKGVAARSTA